MAQGLSVLTQNMKHEEASWGIYISDKKQQVAVQLTNISL